MGGHIQHGGELRNWGSAQAEIDARNAGEVSPRAAPRSDVGALLIKAVFPAAAVTAGRRWEIRGLRIQGLIGAMRWKAIFNSLPSCAVYGKTAVSPQAQRVAASRSVSWCLVRAAVAAGRSRAP